jgi:23S rRNA pseudouridine1911/1915/1917 synthase
MGIPESCFYHPLWPVFNDDSQVLVVYKPAGLLAQGDRSAAPNLLDLAKDWVKKRYRKPGNVFIGLVHRLDKPVAGAMVFARTSKAAARLSAQFRAGTVSKRYLAVVEGIVAPGITRLENELERLAAGSVVVAGPGPASRLALLSFERLDTGRTTSLIGVTLETGRRHQIRLQLAHAGHPIVGDRRYGAAQALPEGRIALLARELGFDHPTRHEFLAFACPLPRGWPWPSAGVDANLPWGFGDFV